jgi:outer membrane biosynthesis protein TonB
MTDVHRYLRGELTAREMHALEKEALDDPFLADALEGLATRVEMPPPPVGAQPLGGQPLDGQFLDGEPLSPTALEQDLSELRARLGERVAEKKNRPMLPPWMKMAAVFILLVGLGLTGWFTLTKQTKYKADHTNNAPLPPAAADVATAPAAKPAAAAPIEPVTPPQENTAQQESTAPQKRNAPLDKTTMSQRRSAPAQVHIPQTPAAAVPAASTPASATASAEKLASAADRLEALPQATPKKPGSVQTQDVSDSLVSDSLTYKTKVAGNGNTALHYQPLLFAGQVRDANNRPLAGASLVLEGKRKGTITDEEGYFKLYVPPGDTLRKLNVDVPGFDEASVALNNDNPLSNVITLREHQTALNEVVVTGMGIKRKETIAAPPSGDREILDSLWTRASPTIGRAAYLDYLAAGKKSLGADSSILGTVSISFDIDQKGQLSNFKIEQSLSPVQDAGTIRLISEGPSWKLIRVKKARLLVSLSFP